MAIVTTCRSLEDVIFRKINIFQIKARGHDLEISVIVSGNGKDVTVFPVQENIHRNNILSKTIVPARISDRLADRAKAIAVKIAEQLNLSGTLCVGVARFR